MSPKAGGNKKAVNHIHIPPYTKKVSYCIAKCLPLKNMQISLPCFADMENPEYFRLPPANKISPPFPGGSTSLKRSLSDYHNNVSRPPLPPKKLGRSPSGEIANRVNKFEQLAKEGSPPKDDINKGRALISIKTSVLEI